MITPFVRPPHANDARRAIVKIEAGNFSSASQELFGFCIYGVIKPKNLPDVKVMIIAEEKRNDLRVSLNINERDCNTSLPEASRIISVDSGLFSEADAYKITIDSLCENDLLFHILTRQ